MIYYNIYNILIIHILIYIIRERLGSGVPYGAVAYQANSIYGLPGPKAVEHFDDITNTFGFSVYLGNGGKYLRC